MGNTYSVLILPQPKKAGSTLESWNLLSTYMAIRNSTFHQSQQKLVIITSGLKADVQQIVDYGMGFFNEVIVIDDLENMSSTKENYVADVEAKILNIFNEEDIIDKIFWTMGTIFPGVESWQANTKMLNDSISETMNADNFDAPYLQHLVYSSILHKLSYYGNPLIHQLIVDPVEVDVSVYVHDMLHYTIRRHFVHALIDRSSVYSNRFIVEPFFLIGSPFYSEPVGHQKSIDFTFGFTAYDELRRNFLMDILELTKVTKNHENIYYCYTSETGEKVDNRLKYDEYLEKIKQSKTTLLIPAYDVNTFSMHRFVEAISVGCLPIIFEAVYEYGFSGYPDTLKVVEKYLLLDNIENINNKILEVSMNHETILAELLNSSYFKTLANCLTFNSTLYK